MTLIIIPITLATIVYRMITFSATKQTALSRSELQSMRLPLKVSAVRTTLSALSSMTPRGNVPSSILIR